LTLSPYTVALRANGTVLASDSLGAPDPGQFLQRTFSYTSGANPTELGQALEIYIEASSSNGGQADFDLITLSDSAPSQTPEPATFGLIAAGMAVAGIGKRWLKA
jgi:hypothetical protein